MGNWWDNITGDVKSAVGDVTSALSDKSIEHFFSDQGPVAHGLSDQGALGGLVRHLIGGPFSHFGQSGGGSKPAAKTDPPGAASSPAPGSSTPQNLYGFDPLSMSWIYSQAFAPYVQANQQQLQGDIANYGTQMQQALKGASPQVQQAYAVSAPAMQQALSMENAAASNFVKQAPAVDSLIQNLANATNAAKAAQQYASIAPYYQSMVQGSGGLPGTTLPGALPGVSAAPMVTPFTYGAPTSQSTSAAQALQAQQNLSNMAQALTNPKSG